MVSVCALYAVLFAGIIAVAAGQPVAKPVPTGIAGPATPFLRDRFPVRQCLKPLPEEGCTSDSQCCKKERCFACPRCEGGLGGPQFNPGFCIPEGGALPQCAPPPPCFDLCQEDSPCSSDADCCSFQKCLKCPTCIGGKSGSNLATTGKCVDLQGANLIKPLCPLPPLPLCQPDKCTKKEDCRKNELCFRCPKCQGNNGLVFDRPGTCLPLNGLIPSCAFPGPCDGLLLKPALTAEQP